MVNAQILVLSLFLEKLRKKIFLIFQVERNILLLLIYLFQPFSLSFSLPIKKIGQKRFADRLNQFIILIETNRINMTAKAQQIYSNLPKTILECFIKVPPKQQPPAKSKIMQKVTLLQNPTQRVSLQSAPKQKACSHSQSIKQLVQQGDQQFSRGAYKQAINRYKQASEVSSKLQTKEYYKCLQKQLQCYKKLRQRKDVQRIYQQLSLVHIGGL